MGAGPAVLRPQGRDRPLRSPRQESGGGVYQMPQVCRGYSCENDERIWKDFDRMILNTEWIEQNLRPKRPQLVAIRMDRIR